MLKLEDISELPKGVADLLDAVGYISAYDFCKADPKGLLLEITKANKQLKMMPLEPTKDTLKAWREIITASSDYINSPNDQENEKVLTEEEQDSVVLVNGTGSADADNDADSLFVNFEKDPEFKEMLSISPEAEHLNPSLVRHHKLAVSSIPEGILLTKCRGEVEINVMKTERVANAQRREAELKNKGLNLSRIRSFDEALSSDHHVKPLDRGKPRDKVSGSPDLNAGVRPGSRNFIRGVLHPAPGRFRSAAFAAIVLQFFLVLSLICVPLMSLYGYHYEVNITRWMVALAAGLIISLFCYLMMGIRAYCRVCGQRQFVPKKCLKHKKAHHIPVIGYILPTALQAILYKWFYCMYCGTAIRLKK